jgi:hypothetical protein
LLLFTPLAFVWITPWVFLCCEILLITHVP